MVTGEDLWFKQIRSGTDQWSVHYGAEDGPEVAVVTERIIKTPRYSVRFPDGRSEVECADRDGVMEVLCTSVEVPNGRPEEPKAH